MFTYKYIVLKAAKLVLAATMGNPIGTKGANHWTSVDNLTDNGIYRITGTSSTFPTTDDGTLIVLNGFVCTQIFISYKDVIALYRIKKGEWTEWKQIATL